MQEPKFQVGQKVEALWNNAGIYRPVTIDEIHAEYTYRVRSDNGEYWTRSEGQIREPRLSPEEAWEKVGLLIGMRFSERPDYCCVDRENHDRETRHQAYQILGAAQIKITDEVKQRVRRLIGLADDM